MTGMWRPEETEECVEPGGLETNEQVTVGGYYKIYVMRNNREN
jgi:hypothetical protein